MLVSLMEVGVTNALASASFRADFASDGETYVNNVRRISLAANLGIGVHDVYVSASTYDGDVGVSPTYRVTVTGPSNGAQVSAHTRLPATVTAGVSYNVSVTMLNTGTTTWVTSGEQPYSLGSVGDNGIWNVGRVGIAGSVAPGASYKFDFVATAPAQPGTYNYRWGMVQDKVAWFGEMTGEPLTVTVMPPPSAAPTITVSPAVLSLTAGQGANVTWSTTNATSVTRACVASGTGYSGTVTLATSGTRTETGSASWAGYPSSCTWTATGAGGSATFTQTMTTAAAASAAPTITVSPATMSLTAGQGANVTWSTTNATSVTRACVASGTGYSGTVTLATSGTRTETASASWAGYPSTCTWTATGAGGSAKFTQTMTTSTSQISSQCLGVTPASGTYTGALSGGTVWGNNSTGYTTDSSMAVALVHSGLLAVGQSGQVTVTPLDSLPSFTGTTANGVTTSSYATAWCAMRLSLASAPAPSPAPKITVSPAALSLAAGQSASVTWSTTNATSVTRACVASGTGYSGTVTLATSGTRTETASASWAGYPSTCTWTATGPGGSATFTQTMSTTASQISSQCLAVTPASGTYTAALSGGTVWGNNSTGYTTDSSMAVALAHSGLLAPGQSGQVTVTPLDSLPSFTGTTANGVTTSSYATAWCAMRLSLAVSTPVAALSAPIENSFYVAAGGTAAVTVIGVATPTANGAAISKLELLDTSGVIDTKTGVSQYNASVNLAPGLHKLALKATYASGATVTGSTVSVTVQAATAGNGARFVNQNVPATMRAGQPYTVTVTMQNTGTTTWTAGAGFKLGAQNPQDNLTWVPTGRAYLSAPVATGGTAVFTIPMTAPAKAATYDFQWKMVEENVAWFGELSTNLAISVNTGPGPAATLSAASANVRVSGTQTAPVTFSAKGVASSGTITKLELFQGTDSTGFSTTAAQTFTGSAATLSWSPVLNLPAGVYLFKLRATDAANVATESAVVRVNITNSTLLGLVSGVATRADKNYLLGWSCQSGVAAPLNYQLFLDAPTFAAGATLLESGVANIATEANNAVVQSQCATPGAAHNFTIDLSPYIQYAGRQLYVRASNAAGTSAITLPCADNNCTVPGSLRVGISTPAPGATFYLPNPAFLRMVVAGATAPLDEVGFSVNGTWIVAKAETDAPGAYSASTTLAASTTPYTVQAKIRQGNTTLFSTQNQFTVSSAPAATVAITAPAGATTVAPGAVLALSASASGTPASVKFFANGAQIGVATSGGGGWNYNWTTGVANSYNVVARSYDAGGAQLAESAPVAVTVTASAGSSATPIAVSVAPLYLSNDEAGTLPGDLDVHANGDASYSMAIVAPPGTAGMQPALSLDYSGSAGNSVAGLGWSLGGMSSIHRCGKTIAQDGVNRAISFDTSDRLCLDGKRLVRTNDPAPADGTQASKDVAYWAENGVYRTEIDTFNRITAILGPAISGAGSTIAFKVETKDAKVRFYGCDVTGSGCGSTNASNSYVAVAATRQFALADASKVGKAVSWALSGEVDAMSNHIDFDYSLDANTGEHLLRQIRYGGNFTAAQSHYAAVRLVYVVRPDAWTRYIADVRNDLRHRLASINTYVDTVGGVDDTGGALVRNYQLAYDRSPTSGRSLLTSVTLCATSSTIAVTGQVSARTCYPATEFSWGKPKSGVAQVFANATPGLGWGGKAAGDCARDANTAPCLVTHGVILNGPTVYTGGATHTDYFEYSDFENNGLVHILEKRTADVSSGVSTAAQPLAQTLIDQGSNPQQQHGKLQQSYRYFHNTGAGFVQYKYALSSNEWFVVLSVSDFNGDGYPDLLVMTNPAEDAGGTGHGTPKVCLSTLAASLPAAGSTLVFDCNSGMAAVGENNVASIPTVIDVVGDGRTGVYGNVKLNVSTGVASATLCLQASCVDNQTDIPRIIAGQNIPDLFMDSLGYLRNYASFESMIDFSGTGKPEIVQWTSPKRVATCVGSDCSCPPSNPSCYTWKNPAPVVLVNTFTAPGGLKPPAVSYAHSITAPGASVTFPPYSFNTAMNMGSLVADFNGNGYSSLFYGLYVNAKEPVTNDIVAAKLQGVQCLSTGIHLDCTVRAALTTDVSLGSTGFLRTLAVADFDGDGQSDILMIKQDGKGAAIGNELQLCHLMGDYASDGTAFGDTNVSCSSWTIPGISAAQLQGALNAVSPTARVDQMYVLDVKGTGRPQLIYHHVGRYTCECASAQWIEDGRWEVLEPADLAEAGQALDHIHAVKNGLGAVSTVTYVDGLASGIVGRSGAVKPVYPQRLTTRSGKIVSKISRSNGVSAAASPATQYRTSTYVYQDAAVDLQGRGSLGFGLVMVTDEQTAISTATRYRQDWPYSGMAASAVSTSGAIKLSETTNTLQATVSIQKDGSKVYFPYVKQSVVVKKDLLNKDLGTVTTDEQYDAWGNLTQQDITSVAGDEKFVTTRTSSFKDPGTTWQIALPTDVTLTNTLPNGTTLKRTVGHTYEANGLLATETVQPGNRALEVVTTYVRTGNLFGLVKEKKQDWYAPLLTGTGNEATQSHRTVAGITYAPNGRFVSSLTDAMLNQEKRTYDPATGALVQSVDPNGLATTWIVDGFGRVTRKISPDGNEVRVYLKDVRNCSDCVAGATVAEITDNFHTGKGVSGRISAPQMVYLDNVGRVLRKQSWGFNGKAIRSDQNYDTRGLPYETYQSSFDNKGALGRRVQYDVLNRVTMTTSLDSDGKTELSTAIDYAGLTTTVTNPKIQKRTEVRNAIGQLRKITDANGKLTSLEYDHFGNLSKAVDPNKNETVVRYDLLGRKIFLNDPDLGTINYLVDALGRTVQQETPELRNRFKTKTTFQYDLIDRLKGRLEADLTSYWEFDTATNGKGKLRRAYTAINDNGVLKPDYDRVHTYDELGRPSTVTQTLADGLYTSTPTYDEWSRVTSTTYRRGTDLPKKFDIRYNSMGYQSAIERSGTKLAEITTQDAAGRSSEISLGNGLTQSRIFNPYTAQLDSAALNAGASLRISEGYEYDKLGNVSKRLQHWLGGGFQEDFTYDALNRLYTSGIGTETKTYLYDDAGNITSKTGLGTYKYLPQGANMPQPHALQGFNGVTSFVYDTNGNLTSGAGRTLTWTSFDMPSTITKGGASAKFVYGPEHQRVGQSRGDGTYIIYAGAQEVEKAPDGKITVKTYWPDGVGVEIDRPNVLAPEMSWTHRDRLGSVIGASDEQGALREPLEYDSWGKRRSTVNNSTTEDSIDGKVDNRGYTGHEMLDQLDLVHMNGRVYDPAIGRFLSADPLVQDPTNGQSYNRYSYVFNNPTNFTDPTGFAACGDAHVICGRTLKEWLLQDIEASRNLFRGYVQQTRAFLKKNGGDGRPQSPNSWSNFKNGFVQGVSNASQSRGYPDVTDGTADKTSIEYLLGTGVGTAFVANAAFGGRMPAGEGAGTASPEIGGGTAPRTGPHGVDPNHHNANVTIRDADGNIRVHDRVVSGNMTPAEKALGFPKGMMASHTEARAVTTNALSKGETMTITGQSPPCTNCRGSMNRAATESGATIKYQWRENGATQTWIATPKN